MTPDPGDGFPLRPILHEPQDRFGRDAIPHYEFATPHVLTPRSNPGDARIGTEHDGFWAQYLVIWYGDLPEETAFVMHRTAEAPWAVLAWIVLFGCFLIPFVTLLSREVKRRPRGLLTIALVVLVSMWLERFMLVSPSLWKGEFLPLGSSS